MAVPPLTTSGGLGRRMVLRNCCIASSVPLGTVLGIYRGLCFNEPIKCGGSVVMVLPSCFNVVIDSSLVADFVVLVYLILLALA